MKKINSVRFVTYFVTVAFLILGFSPALQAQTMSVCPTESFPPNSGLPRVIFPITPIAGQAWQACYQNPTPCDTPNPLDVDGIHLQVISTPGAIELRTQWLNIPFSPCPDKRYRMAEMPVLPTPGPVTVRLTQRTADGIENLPLFPFIQTFEQVIQVQAAPISSVGVPALDWRAALGLSALMIGVAGLNRRR